MTKVIEVRPSEYQISHNGHLLKQHYFTKESADMKVRTLR
jgi:hypothetical protein